MRECKKGSRVITSQQFTPPVLALEVLGRAWEDVRSLQVFTCHSVEKIPFYFFERRTIILQRAVNTQIPLHPWVCAHMLLVVNFSVLLVSPALGVYSFGGASLVFVRRGFTTASSDSQGQVTRSHRPQLSGPRPSCRYSRGISQNPIFRVGPWTMLRTVHLESVQLHAGV